MGIEFSQTNTLVWAIVAIVAVIQTISLIVIAVYLTKISRSFDRLTANVSAFLDVAKRSVERIEPRIHAISQTVQGQLQQVDRMTIELLARSKTRATAFDKLIGDLLRTSDYANHEIEQTTRRAFREALALNAAMRAALGCLFSRRRR